MQSTTQVTCALLRGIMSFANSLDMGLRLVLLATALVYRKMPDMRS